MVIEYLRNVAEKWREIMEAWQSKYKDLMESSEAILQNLKITKRNIQGLSRQFQNTKTSK